MGSRIVSMAAQRHPVFGKIGKTTSKKTKKL